MRPDLSEQLIHFTRGESDADAEATFRKIITDRALLGSSNQIRGGFNVVCFNEAPVYVLARVSPDHDHPWRYSQFGFMVPKAWFFAKGGRQVIYQPEEEFAILPESEQYRHVRLEQPGGPKDWTFEREWRIRTECLPLEPDVCTVIVPDKEWESRLRQEHDQLDMRIAGAMGMNPFTCISRFPWHFLALSDLA